VDEAERERLANLPDTAEVRGRTIQIDYDVEEDGTAIARLRLPEKFARTMAVEELPTLDRPLRFVVVRGQRGAVRAATLDELQELLDQPWSPDELRDRPDDGDWRNKRSRRPQRGHRKREKSSGHKPKRSGKGRMAAADPRGSQDRRTPRKGKQDRRRRG
jgi:ATP-dependent helicase HrpA